MTHAIASIKLDIYEKDEYRLTKIKSPETHHFWERNQPKLRIIFLVQQGNSRANLISSN